MAMEKRIIDKRRVDTAGNIQLPGGQFKKTKNTVHIILPTKKDTVVGMDELSGWWYNMKAEDMDNDGDLDFVLGNRG